MHGHDASGTCARLRGGRRVSKSRLGPVLSALTQSDGARHSVNDHTHKWTFVNGVGCAEGEEDLFRADNRRIPPRPRCENLGVCQGMLSPEEETCETESSLAGSGDPGLGMLLVTCS